MPIDLLNIKPTVITRDLRNKFILIAALIKSVKASLTDTNPWRPDPVFPERPGLA